MGEYVLNQVQSKKYLASHDIHTTEIIKAKHLSNRGSWFLLSKVTGLSQFGRLSKIAALVLVLLHSNADAERFFSMVGLNKTKTRNSLALDGTLSSIMTVKMAGLEPQGFKWEPPTPVLKASKPATNTYNKQH